MDSFIGRTLGRYEILGELGRGGMGVVYRARDTSLHREVALKVLPAELVADPDRKRRFFQEARTASALEHPHIGVIHEVGEDAGISFIAMELIRGRKLSDLLDEKGLETRRVLELATEIAEGLARAHDRNIVHRDLKPANVMVTEDGHAKIIDFGLAKLLEQSAESDAETVQGTNPGVVMGTTSYMSPEQARAGKIDHRSDIFSFGVMLYEMLAGRLPFTGRTGVDTLHAILHDATPPLPSLTAGVSAEATADLQRLIDKCLAKDPDSRYQGMRDLIVDLRTARRRLESGAQPTSVSAAASTAASISPHGTPIVPTSATSPEAAPARSLRTYALAAAAVTALALVAGVSWNYLRSSPPPADSGKPSVAVLYFQNNTGNPQLDWLRRGLTEMMVTDLSQSTDVDILSTDRLYQVMKDLHQQNETTLSFDAVQSIAKRAGVRHVLIGSYVKAGNAIRITTTLQEAATGKIVKAEHIDAADEGRLFSVVDDLTARIKTQFAANAATALLTRPGTPPVDAPRALVDVTTSSPEAYKLYAQGLDLHQHGHAAEAIPMFKQAIAVDPQFALALARLAVIYGNQGRWDLREEFNKRALEHADHLTPRERLYITGNAYHFHDETLNQAIKAYQDLLVLYPDDDATLNNLGLSYNLLDRPADAIPLFQRAIRHDPTLAIPRNNLAESLIALDRLDDARQPLDEYIQTQPPATGSLRQLASVLVTAGKFDEARAAIEKADAIDGSTVDSMIQAWRIAISERRMPDAAATAAALFNGTNPFGRFVGANFSGKDAWFAGKAATALAVLAAAEARGGPGPSDQMAITHSEYAEALLLIGKPAEALELAQRASKEKVSSIGGWDHEYLTILALSRLHRDAEAGAAFQAVKLRAEALPSDRETRNVHWLTGVMALDRHDAATAVSELTLAEHSLLPRSVFPPPTVHGRIWFALGQALLAAGDDAGAAKRFVLITTRTEGASHPIEMVRSWYYLGQIADRQGDRAKAREGYQRFLDYWGNGDMDRDWVADATRKLR